MSLSKEFYIMNRQRLMGRIPEGTTVLLFAGKSKAMCQDSEYRFLPDRNFYYMTGLSYEGGILVMNHEKTWLFALPHDAMKERWQGKRLGFEKVSEISGVDINDIYPIDDFDGEIINMIIQKKCKVAFDEKSIMEQTMEVRNRLVTALSDSLVTDISETLIELRMIKQPEEIAAIREATRMTETALKYMKELIKPGVSELELYTALDYHMARQGALIPAFPTIVANNTNSFYLHHSEPEGMDGELTTNGGYIQIDVGARADGYCGDISRTYFVGDKTGEDDKRFILLELIQKLRKEAFAFIKPGVNMPMLNEKMRDITSEYLAAFGLTAPASDYYWHNTGHHLGLDVHDCSLGKDKMFEAGNCLAIEPGVYIPEWGVGFRIEDDVLVTESGAELLSSGTDSVEDVVIK